MAVLSVETRSHPTKLSLRSSPMEVFEKSGRTTLDTRHIQLITKKTIIKPTSKIEIAVVPENGTKTNDDPVSSMSPEQPVSSTPATLQRTMGRVVISLQNLILPNERLYPTPSMKEGLDSRTEWHLRRLGCDLIQHAGNGKLLELPQTAMATAQVLYQRFYHVKSFLRHDYMTMAMACIYLASKVEEFPRRLRDIINVFTHVRQTLCQLPIEPVILDYGYVNLKNQVIKCERRLLKELGFCVHVKHPHQLVNTYLGMLDLIKNEHEPDLDKKEPDPFVQRAWNYMNDSARTDLCLRYSPEAIACGCIFLAARDQQVPLPQTWSLLFGTTKSEMEDIARNILLVYSIKLPPILEIEAKINAMKKAMDAERTKGLLNAVRQRDADLTPDSVQTTPEDLARIGRERQDSKEKSSSTKESDRAAEKRPRDPSHQRPSRDTKQRRHSPHYSSSSSASHRRSRSHDRDRPRHVIRNRDRKRSPSPRRTSRDRPEAPLSAVPSGGEAKRQRILPPRRGDDDGDRRRRRSRSCSTGTDRRWASRSPDRSSYRRDRRY